MTFWYKIDGNAAGRLVNWWVGGEGAARGRVPVRLLNVEKGVS